MVRTLAFGFGLATALAVAGSMTPTGQAMLGLRHPAEKATTVTVIQDKPAAVPAPAVTAVPALNAAPAQPSSSAPQVRPVPRVAQPSSGAPQARPIPQTRPSIPQDRGQAVPPQGGQGGLASVANILLNLPQVLDQTHVGPARGSDSWSESRPAPSESEPASQEPVKIFKKKHAEPDRQHKPVEDSNN
jgi:hypothetical protein